MIKKLFKLLMLPFTILGLIISLVTPATADKPKKPRNPYDENYFTDKLIAEHGFEAGTEYKLPHRFKADMYTEDYVIEVDWESKMYEGLGQALTYAYYSSTHTRPAIVILDDVNKSVDFQKFFEVFDAYDVKVWVVEVDRTNGDILNITER